MAEIEGKRISELAGNASIDGTAVFPHTQNNTTMKVTLSAIATFILSQVDASIVGDAVSAWLTAHPEATTTVEDGSISTAKLANGAVTVEKLADATIISLLPNDLKTALLQLASKVAYIDEHGQDYYDDLYDALYPPIPATAISLNSTSITFSTIGTTQTLTATVVPPNTSDTVEWTSSDDSVATVSQSGVVTSVAYGSAIITATAGNVSATCSVVIAQVTLSSITAVYTQTGTVYPTTSLNNLKSDLVVTANWSDQTQTTVSANDYTLSGTLSVGSSTVTVSYGGKTTTFSVTVSELPTLASISAVYTQTGTVLDTDSLDSLKSDLVVTATYSDSSTAIVPSSDYTLSGSLTAGTSTITVTYESKTTTFSVTVTHYGYVTDGLVMWLDGEKNSTGGTHATTLTTWVDQSGNGWDWTNSGATVNAKSLSFNGTNAYLYRDYQSVPSNVAMMEVVYKRTKGGCVLTGFGRNKVGNINIHSTAGSITFHTGTGTAESSNTGFNPNETAGTIISVNSAGYVNGVAVVTAGNGNDWQYEYPAIGKYRGSNGGNTQYVFQGEIFCIRLYSRILTEQEILANYAVDAQRFGIGE